MRVRGGSVQGSVRVWVWGRGGQVGRFEEILIFGQSWVWAICSGTVSGGMRADAQPRGFVRQGDDSLEHARYRRLKLLPIYSCQRRFLGPFVMRVCLWLMRCRCLRAEYEMSGTVPRYIV
jgi:hypothetical protein